MKKLLQQYAAYNKWANEELTQLILSLSEEQQRKEVTSSFNGLHKTIFHLWDAESIWWQRMTLQEMVTRPSDNRHTTTLDVVNGLLNQSGQWEEWVMGASEVSLHEVFLYQTSNKEQHELPVYQMLLHLFNHGSYHRGQLVTILRQLGVEKIPSTDFNTWCRTKKFVQDKNL